MIGEIRRAVTVHRARQCWQRPTQSLLLRHEQGNGGRFVRGTRICRVESVEQRVDRASESRDTIRWRGTPQCVARAPLTQAFIQLFSGPTANGALHASPDQGSVQDVLRRWVTRRCLHANIQGLAPILCALFSRDSDERFDQPGTQPSGAVKH